MAAFLDGRIGFMDIHRINAETLSRLTPQLAPDHGLDDLIALDQEARAAAGQALQGVRA